MTQVINGKDIWMGKDEVLARWFNKTIKPVQETIPYIPSESTPVVRRGRPRKSEV